MKPDMMLLVVGCFGVGVIAGAVASVALEDPEFTGPITDMVKAASQLVTASHGVSEENVTEPSPVEAEGEENATVLE